MYDLSKDPDRIANLKLAKGAAVIFYRFDAEDLVRTDII